MDPCTMFGYDENKNPVVAEHITPPQARKIARDKGLTGHFLAPHWSETPNNGGMRAYKWDSKKGDYEYWTMRAWAFTRILDPKVDAVLGYVPHAAR
ncbi:MAG: hypothetical protein M3Q49_08130 [Actinomycetota bacterium]|nr:hypothetical protein [Actinomycetota bacterium]MDP9485734.1 hypothetical protein [Actinomycetota bacterium]